MEEKWINLNKMLVFTRKFEMVYLNFLRIKTYTDESLLVVCIKTYRRENLQTYKQLITLVKRLFSNKKDSLKTLTLKKRLKQNKNSFRSNYLFIVCFLCFFFYHIVSVYQCFTMKNIWNYRCKMFDCHTTKNILTWQSFQFSVKPEEITIWVRVCLLTDS